MAAFISTRLSMNAFMVGVAIWAALDFALLVFMVRQGTWAGAALTALLASAIPMALLVATLEQGHRTLADVFGNIREQSWMFLFGDTIFLPAAAAMAALAWRASPQLQDTWATSWWWTASSALAGLLAGCWFRFSNDRPAYQLAGAESAFYSPTKLFHDLGAYPVLFGGLLAVGVPLFLKMVSTTVPFVHFYAAPYLWLMLAGIGLWLAAGVVHDLGLFGPPRTPARLHPNTWMWPQP